MDLSRAKPESEEDLHRPVTGRERQVIELVAKGKLNKEIARDLRLSEGTIKEYLHKIFRKIQVTNRTELAVLAVAHPEELMGMTPPQNAKIVAVELIAKA